MGRVLKWILRGSLAIVLVLGLVVGVLALTTPRPRDAQGWTRFADMPTPRGEVAMAATFEDEPEPGDGQRVVVAGGIRGAGRTVATVSVYDVDADSWSAGPDLPDRRDHAAAAAIGGDVYVSGGQQRATAREPETNLWVLRRGGDEWLELASLPEGRTGHGMVALDGRLYVVGGQGPSARVLVHGDGRWQARTPLPVQRDHLAVLVHDGRIWAIGGRSGFRDVLDRVDVYDPNRDVWEPGPALPIPMSAMAAGVVDGVFHVVGGEEPSVVGGRVIDRHVTLNPEERSWRVGPLPIVAVHGVPGAVAGGRLLVSGGSRRQGALSVLGWTGVTQAYPR